MTIRKIVDRTATGEEKNPEWARTTNIGRPYDPGGGFKISALSWDDEGGGDGCPPLLMTPTDILRSGNQVLYIKDDIWQNTAGATYTSAERYRRRFITMTEALNERIKRLIEERGISQRELARQTGITESSVCHYCKGDRIPNSATIAKIARALGTTPNYLLFGEPFTENDQLNASIEMIKRCSAYLSKAQKIEIINSLIDEND